MYWKDNGLFVLRILTGLMMFYHGLREFKPDTMNSYQECFSSISNFRAIVNSFPH